MVMVKRCGLSGKDSLAREAQPEQKGTTMTRSHVSHSCSADSGCLKLSLAVRQLWPFDQTQKCVFMCKYMEVFMCAANILSLFPRRSL